MSLKVSKGQKITAIHTNKIVDAICSLENTTNKLQQQRNQSKDLIQVPVFDFCWYQPDDTNVVLYVNTQNEPDKMVMYNGCYSTYCDLGYELPTTDATYPPPLTISGDYLVNASYSAIKNFTLGCDAVQNICLTIFKDGISSSYYTFADEDKLPSGDCETIVQTFLIGTYSKGNFQQLHDGILTYSDLSGANESIKVDTEVSNSGVATIERIYSSSISSDYISLYHADEGYDNPLLRSAISAEDTTDDCGSVLSPLDSELRTVFLRKSWNTIETGETDDEGNPLSISVPNTTIEYGKPEEYFIINDVCGVETAPFVLPKQLSSYCDLVIGNNDCETYYSTLYFENPWKTDLLCPGENPLVRTDYVLVLDMCETDPEDGPCRAVWKRYLPGMEAGAYIRVAEGEPGSSHIATISGPYMCLRINNDTNNGVQEFKYDPINHIWWLYLNQMHIKSGDYIKVSMDPVDGYYAINGPKMVLDTKCATCDSIANNGVDGSFTYDNNLNQWTLKLELDTETLSSNICIEVDSNVEVNSGDYINVTGGNNSYTVNGPEMCLCITNKQNCDTLPNPLTGTFEYLNNTWTLNLQTDISAMTGGGLTTELSAGDYIHIDESTTADGNPLYTVHGPDMCVCVTNSLQCETLNPITASFAYDNDTWTLNIEADTIGGSDLSAGDYITIEEGKINGAGITIACTDTVKGTASYNNGSWELNLDATVDLEDIEVPNGVCVVAGRYVTVEHTTANDVDTYKVNAPAMSISKAEGIDAAFMYFNGTWMLGLCVDQDIYNAGNYITIDGNNNIYGAGITIGTGGNVTGNATHNAATNTWTLNLNAPTGGTTYGAGSYITIDGYNNINGANVTMGTLNGLTGNVAYDANTNEFQINLATTAPAAKWVTNFALVSWNNYSMTFKIDYSDGSSVTNTVTKSGI